MDVKFYYRCQNRVFYQALSKQVKNTPIIEKNKKKKV